MERIAAILDPKDAHQEAVHAKHHAGPDKDCCLLHLGVRHAWDLDGEGNCRE